MYKYVNRDVSHVYSHKSAAKVLKKNENRDSHRSSRQLFNKV